jgi:LacI family transcriptional regulator
MIENDAPRRRPTIEDVAQFTNLSRQTISRVINDKGEVSAPTRERVLAAIRELGYRPNALARSLVTSRSNVIGLIVPDISQPFYPEIARGVEDGADEAGYSVFLCHSAGSPERERRAIDRLQGHRVDGVIICNPRLDDAALKAALDAALPVVLVNRTLPNVAGVVIWPGYDSGLDAATEHLLLAGRRHIVYLGLDRPNRIDVEKRRGFRQALDRHGVHEDPAQVVPTSESLTGGYRALERLIERGDTVDGVVAFNDLMAIGAMRYAVTHGMRVPEDVAIVGFGGSDVAAMVTPALSTIEAPLYEIGRTAIAELLSLVEGSPPLRDEVHISPRLIVRESSAVPAPASGASPLVSE